MLVDVATNLTEQPFVYRLVNCYLLAQPTVCDQRQIQKSYDH